MTSKEVWLRRLRRLGITLVVLVLLEPVCNFVLFLPGPLTLAYVGSYNGFQWTRAHTPSPTATWRRHKSKGPPPDPKVVTAANHFGFRLLHELVKEQPDRNLFYSPYSVAAAMTLAANGAESQTLASMRTALGYDALSSADVDRAYKRIGDLLNYVDPKVQVFAANGLWADDDVTLQPDFVRGARDSYGAAADTLDLQGPWASRRINGWVRRHTGGHIGRVYSPQKADGVVLANAVYFHGEWKYKFQKSNTRLGPFYLLDGSEKQLPMMHQKAEFGYYEERNTPSHGESYEATGESEPEREEFAAARLPYGDGSMAMYIFLPREKDGLSRWLKSMSGKRWDAWMARFRPAGGSITLPRFRVQSGAALKGALSALGMKDAFDPDRADFRAMGRVATGEPLYLDRVLHRAFVEVDEEGTTAAAMTIPTFGKAGEHSGRRFVVDHPFFCAIRDERTGLILFAGAIYDPEVLAG